MMGALGLHPPICILGPPTNFTPLPGAVQPRLGLAYSPQPLGPC